MHLDGTFGISKMSPAEERKTELDGGRIECVNRSIQIDLQAVARVKLFRSVDKYFREFGIYAIIPQFVGIRKGTSRDGATEAKMVQTGLMGAQTYLDVPQTLALGQLRKGHAEKLIPTTETLDAIVPLVMLYASVEFVPRQESKKLREDILACVHDPTLLFRKAKEVTPFWNASSNRKRQGKYVSFY